MNIAGTYTLQATQAAVWHCLVDPQLLLKTIPGVEYIKKVDTDRYEVAIQVKSAPLKETYRGRITVSEQQFPFSCHIVLDHIEGQSTFQGEGSIHLREHEQSTIIEYEGRLNISKHGTVVAPELVRGAAKLFMQQFFNALADQLRVSAQASLVTGGGAEQAEGMTVTGKSVQLLVRQDNEVSPTSSTVWHTIVRTLKLGGTDSMEQERWETRIRRASMLSGLLVLVWVGTRLPRRRG
ncbi:MAG TPA: SRPBCC domain-containing protein [Ktedonobacteraceae bacterium]|nr:SRPBCC domain-containing protein [Ktedonobacteraceae bacterium]